ncbi:MAG: MCE family protein [Mycobacteriaceae bacterium]
MKRFEERNPIRIAIFGLTITLIVVLAAINYDKIPLIKNEKHYSAYFADVAGLLPGDAVLVSGVTVGEVEDVTLSGPKVLVKFSVKKSISIGDKTRVNIATTTVLGKKSLVITPEGTGSISVSDPIPLERTVSPYSLNDVLADLTETASDLDTDQLNRSLDAISEVMKEASPELHLALDGVSALSKSINSRDSTLQQLLNRAKEVTSVLADRSAQINALVLDGNQLFSELNMRRNAIAQLIVNIGSVSQQLSGVIQDNKTQLAPTLDRLNTVIDNLLTNKGSITKALETLAPYSTALGEAVSEGPWFNAYVANYSMGNYMQIINDALLAPDQLPETLQEFLRTISPNTITVKGSDK